MAITAGGSSLYATPALAYTDFIAGFLLSCVLWLLYVCTCADVNPLLPCIDVVHVR